jgi:hypothetical protein
MTKTALALSSLSGVIVFASLGNPSLAPSFDEAEGLSARSVAHGAVPRATEAELNDVVQDYCVRCHSERRLTGNLSLEAFDVATAHETPEVSEKVILKLRAGMMPPAGANRPAGDTLMALVETLETTVDEAAERDPSPGSRVFQRLNRAEYERSISDLLGMTVNAADYLPEDTKSANFDNIADVQMLSPTLMSAYLNAASEVARLAVGDPDAVAKEAVYRIPRLASQTTRVEGAPYGSRGGVSVIHNFPADGTYDFRMMFHHSPEGYLFGRNEPGEQVEVSIDGERVALLPLDRFTGESDPGGKGLTLETGPIPVRAGPHRVSAVFIPTERGPVDDLFRSYGFSIPDLQIGIGYGLTMPPHMRDLTIRGPEVVTGVSDNAIRRGIFTCRPAAAEEARPCAERIIGRLAEDAYRRPLEQADLDGLMWFYDEGAADGGFEAGVRRGLEAILASPHFVFRLEEMPDGVEDGEVYRLTDADLAARLSFFLWGSPPDDELLRLAREGELSDDDVLREQTMRMLADPRSEALASRFAAQWLRLQDLYKLDPDVQMFPDYDLRLASAMERETELFFSYLVRENRPVLELLTADYTFVNERLADHYEIPGVVGDQFRRVAYPSERRRGILGHGSVLALTSLANRTSPVNRGKWVSEVLLGAPPPPPPPNVPSLDESAAEASDTRRLTTRERMEMHRANPTCNSCHSLIDPIGLALDHFDVTGAWRIKENDMPIDVRGELYDGTPLASANDLTGALVSKRVPVLRNFTRNLMAYALGRRVEYYDMPQVRQIVEKAEEDGARTTSFILGVVESDAFRMRRASLTTDQAQQH